MTNLNAASITTTALLAAVALSIGQAAETESTWRDQAAHSRALYDQGRFEDAEKSLASFVKLTARPGLSDLDLAEALTEAGGLYMNLGRFAEGTRLLERSLALWDKQPGVRHPGPLWASNSLVTAYIETQQLDRARKLAERTLQTRQEILNLYPEEQAHTLHELATIYHFRGKHRDAESLLRKSISLMELHGSADTADMMYVLVSMAGVLLRTAQPDEALSCILRARRTGEKLFAPDHVFLARVFIAESSVYRALRRPSNALMAIERALAIVPSSMEPLMRAALDEHARVLRLEGQKRNAEAVEARANEIGQRIESANRHTVDIRALTRDRGR